MSQDTTREGSWISSRGAAYYIISSKQGAKSILYDVVRVPFSERHKAAYLANWMFSDMSDYDPYSPDDTDLHTCISTVFSEHPDRGIL
jgi:hypothetical protein